jgi:hypothetical protein
LSIGKADDADIEALFEVYRDVVAPAPPSAIALHLNRKAASRARHRWVP